LKNVLHDRNISTAVGDEGGFAPNFSDNEDALRVIEEAVDRAGYAWGEQIFITLDPASSEMVTEARKLGKEGYCFFSSDPTRVASSDEMIDLWADWCSRYPIRSIEDGLGEDDWSGWKELTKRLGEKIQLVGDDLFVTNRKFLDRGIKEECANSILIKVNQIGTLTETFATVDMAHDNGYSATQFERGRPSLHTPAGIAKGERGGSLQIRERTGLSRRRRNNHSRRRTPRDIRNRQWQREAQGQLRT